MNQKMEDLSFLFLSAFQINKFSRSGTKEENIYKANNILVMA